MMDQLIGPGDNDYGRAPAPVGFSRDTIPRVRAAIAKNPPIPSAISPASLGKETIDQVLAIQIQESMKGPDAETKIRSILTAEFERLHAERKEKEFLARAAKVEPLRAKLKAAMKYHTFLPMTPERIDRIADEVLPIISAFLFGPLE